MPLNQEDWDELIHVIAGALANLDVKIRALESVQSLSQEDLAVRTKHVRETLFQELHRNFQRTLMASHQQKTHRQMDLEWMEKELEKPDSDEPRS